MHRPASTPSPAYFKPARRTQTKHKYLSWNKQDFSNFGRKSHVYWGPHCSKQEGDWANSFSGTLNENNKCQIVASFNHFLHHRCSYLSMNLGIVSSGQALMAWPNFEVIATGLLWFKVPLACLCQGGHVYSPVCWLVCLSFSWITEKNCWPNFRETCSTGQG